MRLKNLKGVYCLCFFYMLQSPNLSLANQNDYANCVIHSLDPSSCELEPSANLQEGASEQSETMNSPLEETDQLNANVSQPLSEGVTEFQSVDVQDQVL